MLILELFYYVFFFQLGGHHVIFFHMLTLDVLTVESPIVVAQLRLCSYTINLPDNGHLFRSFKVFLVRSNFGI